MNIFFNPLKTNGTEGEKIRIGRTKEGTIFEMLTFVLLVMMWAVAAWVFFHTSDTVATHFDLKGEADGYGNRWGIIIVAAVGTLVTVLCLVGAYSPQRAVNLPIKIKNAQQNMIASRMMRVMAALAALLFTNVILMMGMPDAPLPRYLLFVTVGLTIAAPIVLTVLVVRTRNR